MKKTNITADSKGKFAKWFKEHALSYATTTLCIYVGLLTGELGKMQALFDDGHLSLDDGRILLDILSRNFIRFIPAILAYAYVRLKEKAMQEPK